MGWYSERYNRTSTTILLVSSPIFSYHDLTATWSAEFGFRNDVTPFKEDYNFGTGAGWSEDNADDEYDDERVIAERRDAILPIYQFRRCTTNLDTTLVVLSLEPSA
uniref:Uncharacterized protein n=1 Tax=Glossina pallidipes TaxID=7398 RepID=A0A1A9ZW89_GLOPL